MKAQIFLSILPKWRRISVAQIIIFLESNAAKGIA